MITGKMDPVGLPFAFNIPCRFTLVRCRSAPHGKPGPKSPWVNIGLEDEKGARRAFTELFLSEVQNAFLIFTGSHFIAFSGSFNGGHVCQRPFG